MKPTYFQHQLSLDDEALACRTGYARQLPMMGQPRRNRNFSEGDCWEIHQHIIVAGSEIAFARMCGLDCFEPTVNTFKTEPDVGTNECGVEIRYSYKGDTLRISANQKYDRHNMVYALMTGGLHLRRRRSAAEGWLGPAYICLGWASYDYAKQFGEYKPEWNSYLLPKHLLLDINDFTTDVNAVKKYL